MGMGNAGRGAHSHALAAAQAVYNGRKTIASFFGAEPQQVVFTSGATESLNIAIRGLLKPGDHIITTVLEHNSVLRPLYGLGVDMGIIGLQLNGDLDYAGFKRCLRPNTKAVVITTASNVTGLLVDIAFVADFCKRHGLLLIVDAAQTAGLCVGGGVPDAPSKAHTSNHGASGTPPPTQKHSPVHVLCFTGHKSLLGPQGIGGMIVHPEISILPNKLGGSGTDSFSHAQPTQMPERLEAGTLNTPGIAGLAAGVEYITQAGMGNIFAQSQVFAEYFHREVSKIPGVKLYSNSALPHVPIVALNIGDMDSATAEFVLSSEYGISVRGGAHCAPLMHTALGTREQGAVRFSFSHFNTMQELEAAVRAVRSVAKFT